MAFQGAVVESHPGDKGWSRNREVLTPRFSLRDSTHGALVGSLTRNIGTMNHEPGKGEGSAVCHAGRAETSTIPAPTLRHGQSGRPPRGIMERDQLESQPFTA